MAIDFKLPEIAEGVDKGDVGTIHVKEGDTIATDQLVLEVETDKAVLEVTCPHAGQITKLLVQSGETVQVGQSLMTIEESSPAAAKESGPAAGKEPAAKTSPKPADVAPSKAEKPRRAPGSPIEFKLPEIAEGVDKGDVGTLHVKVGDIIAADQLVVEVETDKAVLEVTCPHAGRVAQVHVRSGDTIQVGQPLLTIEPDASQADSEPPAGADEPSAREPQSRPKADFDTSRAKSGVDLEPPPKRPAEAPVAVRDNGEKRTPAPAGPATRRLARELGVDLFAVAGSGPNGRITQDDVQSYVRERLKAPSSGGVVVPPLPDFAQFGPIERQPLNKLSKVSAANLSLSWQVVPHVTQHELVDVTDLEAGRKRFGQKNESSPKVTMTVLAMKAITTVLKAFPNFNASFDAPTGELILKHYYNIGVAVDTEQGLVVPVIRDADRKSVMELAQELTDLSGRARSRKLAISEMQGGTFTITNLGGIGGSFFTPIVNYPEVAILGMSRAVQQYVFIDGKPEVRLMMPLSLSYDHRVVNGADAARFIVKLAGLLADPFKLLSEV